MLQTIKVFILFTGCTLLFYYGILWISKEYENYYEYDEPKGKVIKVFHMDDRLQTFTWKERLLLLYKEGE